MALRAFQRNPSLGGFGNESGKATSSESILLDSTTRRRRSTNTSCTNAQRNAACKGDSTSTATTTSGSGGGGTPIPQNGCDAFAQIIKELVDNAVDACKVRGTNKTLVKSATTTTTTHDHSTCKGNNDLKRVRVTIETFRNDTKSSSFFVKGGNTNNDKENYSRFDNRELLLVTVNDNGCGMEDVEKCVSAFCTSKSNTSSSQKEKKKSKTNTSKKSNNVTGAAGHTAAGAGQQNQSFTAGRYGVGLTLAFLHAQRLVPNTCASIVSATAETAFWTSATFVVDTDQDSVDCIRKSKTKKQTNESGTSIRLLVPGGTEAKQAWPRLAEYFARFQLCLGLECSLEVMAAPLSTLPLFIRPNFEIDRGRMALQKLHSKKFSMHSFDKMESNDETETFDERNKDSDWTSALVHSHSDPHKSTDVKLVRKENVLNTDCRPNQQEGDFSSHSKLLQAAASSYLNKSIDIKNVAHSVQPIKLGGYVKKKKATGPTLEVDFIIHTVDDESQELEGQMDDSMVDIEGDENDDNTPSGDSMHDSRDLCKGNVMLVRMLNHTPMLDGAEAFACGIVNGIANNQSTWNSFGLEVTANDFKTAQSKGAHRSMKSSSDVPHKLLIPSWSLKDNDQVAPFFAHNRNHSIYEGFLTDDDGDEGQNSVDDFDIENDLESCKSRKRNRMKQLRPAGLRLGNVLIIVQLHAKPSELPLPSLSKGRLPMNNYAIDNALELGLVSCLRSIQKTNPSMLLTTSQLKRTERNVKYIPAVSLALSSLISNCNDACIRNKIMRKIHQWDQGANQSNDEHSSTEQRYMDENARAALRCKVSLRNQEMITKSIEMRFRNVIVYRQECRRKKEQARRTQKKEPNKKRKATGGNEPKVIAEKDLNDFLPHNMKIIDRTCVQNTQNEKSKFILTSQMEGNTCENKNIEDLSSNGLEHLFSKEESIPVSPAGDTTSKRRTPVINVKEPSSGSVAKRSKEKDLDDFLPHNMNIIDRTCDQNTQNEKSKFILTSQMEGNKRENSYIEDLSSNGLEHLFSKEESIPVSPAGDTTSKRSTPVINVKEPSSRNVAKRSKELNTSLQYDGDHNCYLPSNDNTESSIRRKILDTVPQDIIINDICSYDDFTSFIKQNKDTNRNGEDDCLTIGRKLEKGTGSLITARYKAAGNSQNQLLQHEKSQPSTWASSSEITDNNTQFKLGDLDSYNFDEQEDSMKTEPLLESCQDSAEASKSAVKERNAVVSVSSPQSIQATGIWRNEIEAFDDWW